MNHLNQGLLSAYNSLTDKHLTGYFNNTRIRRHLQRVGLITRSGRIVPDKEYRHKLIQRAHQRHVRECLAQAIFHKVLEMERVHQIEIKRKLEEFTRRERVHKIKLDRSKRYEEDVIRILSPRPPTGPRSGRRQHSGPEGEHTESSESPGSSRPNTAPGKMQRPVRLKPIHSNSTTASRRHGSPYRRHDSSNETDHTFSYTMDKDPQRHRTATDFSRGISPYCLPVINNFVTPVPPPTKRKERGLRASGTLRGRRLRPTTAPLAPDLTEESPMLRTSAQQSGVCVNMVFFGKTVHLSHDLIDLRDEVKVFQQHCGGENLCVFKGKLREGDAFQFVSRRHRGFPFSLTFFLNGLQVERLSSCCEFKHRKGSRLGGRHGHFGFTSVEGASPCYKCIIAMGLDKKPTPPPKRIKEDREGPSPEEHTQHRRTSPEEPTQHRRTSPEEPTQHRRISPEEPTQHPPEMEKESESTRKDTSAHTEPELSQPQEMETNIEEDIPPEEDKPRDDYEEDFEADDEGPAEDGEVKEEKISPARERDASDSEEDKKEGDRRSRSASSSSGSDREDSETEADNKGAQTAEPEGDAPKVYQKETPVPPAEEKEQPPAALDTRAAEKDSPVPPLTNGSPRTKESGSDASRGESTELEVSDTSAPLGNGGKVDNDTSGAVEQGKEADKLIGEHPEEQEPERAKSVQEKVAEAILKEAQCSSEPELSDTTTEEEEESTEKRQQQDNDDAVPEKVVNCETSPVTAESAEDQREVNSELKEEDKSPPEPQENNHGVNSEMEKMEDSEMAEPAEDHKQDTTQDSEHGVSGELEKMQDTETAVLDEDGKENTEEKELSEKKTADDKTSEAQSHNEAKPTDTEIDEENTQEEEKVTAEADPEPTETECTKEDESPLSEPENKAEETTAEDKTEVEEVATIEMAEMKPEPQEDLTCEETPVADAEKEGDGEAVPGGPSEGSGDTTVQAEKTADTTEVKAEDEVITEDEKEQAPEEALGAEANNDDRQQESVKDNQTSEKAEEESEKSIKENVEDDKVEGEKSDDNEVGGKETNQDETAEGDKGEVKEQTGEVNLEQEEKHENKEEERINAEEDNGNTEEKAKEEPEVGNSDEGDKVTDEAKVEEVETSERNDEGSKVQDSEDIKGKIHPEDAEEKVTTADTAVEVEGSSHGAAERLENTAEGELEKGNRTANMTDDNVSDHKADDEEKETTNTEDKPEESNMEADSTQKEKENEKAHSEKDERETTATEVDTENGERDSLKASDEQKESQEDGAKTISQEKHDMDGENTEEKNTSSETTKEDPDKVEPEPGSEDHKETGDNCNDDKADQVAETNMENESKIEDTNADVKSESQSEEPNKDTDMEESKQHPDENTEVRDCKESAPEDKANGSDINEKNNNTVNNFNEVILVTSEPQSSQPAAVDLDNMTHKSDEEKEKCSAPSDSKIEKHTNSEANATDDAPSAVDGDTGADTEEASKPSEEGASVVLKPQAESAQLTDKGADQPKESALGKGGDVPEQTARTEGNNVTPESLEIEDSRNLVTNWVTLHQTTKSFQKFSDPIEVESTNTTILQKSASPVQMLPMDEHNVGDEINTESVVKEPEPTVNDGSESKDNAKVEDLHSDLKSNHSKDKSPSESQPTEDAPQVKEESGVTQQAPIAETDNDEEDTTTPANKETSTEEQLEKSGLFEGEKDQEPAANDGSESKDNTKVEDLHSDLKSNHSKDDAPSESQPTEDALQVKEETGVTEPVLITESENYGEDATRGANKEMSTEEHKETSEIFEGGKDQDATTQRDTEQSDICKTEMESITNQSEASVKSDRGPENQREEEITQDDPGVNGKETMIEEIKSVPSPPISEGHQESSESPEKLDPSGITATGEPENTENGDKQEEESTELTEVSDLTLTSKSEEGSQDDSHTGQTQTKQTEGSINGDNKTVQLIKDKKDLNKDPLSVEETSLLGHNTYALLTTTRTEND